MAIVIFLKIRSQVTCFEHETRHQMVTFSFRKRHHERAQLQTSLRGLYPLPQLFAAKNNEAGTLPIIPALHDPFSHVRVVRRGPLF